MNRTLCQHGTVFSRFSMLVATRERISELLFQPHDTYRLRLPVQVNINIFYPWITEHFQPRAGGAETNVDMWIHWAASRVPKGGEMHASIHVRVSTTTKSAYSMCRSQNKIFLFDECKCEPIVNARWNMTSWEDNHENESCFQATTAFCWV